MIPTRILKLLSASLIPFRECAILDFVIWVILPLVLYMVLLKIFTDRVAQTKSSTMKGLWGNITKNWQSMFFSCLGGLAVLFVISSLLL